MALRMSALILSVAIVWEPAQAQESACSIAVDGLTYHHGPCEVDKRANGTTYVRSADQEGDFGYWVHLDMSTATRALAHWNEVYGAGHAHSRLGHVDFEDGCWQNERTRICLDVPIGDSATYRIEEAGSTPGGNILVGNVQGREYIVRNEAWGERFPRSLGERVDLDGDGRDEQIVLVTLGGNGTPPYLSVVSYQGDGFFTFLTQEPIPGSRSGYEIIESDGKPRIRMMDLPTGVGNTQIGRTQREYAVTGGMLTLVAEFEEGAKRLALRSLSIDQVNAKKPREEIFFDLNRDGAVDSLSCSYWERWGNLRCEVCFEGKSCFSIPACKSVGVSRRFSAGVHIITCDHRDIEISDVVYE